LTIIHYTLDGSEPDLDSSVYITSISIDNSAIVRAVAYRDGWLASPIKTSIYSIGAFAGGSGIATDPYLVENALQLNNVREYPNAYFKQTNEIDLNIAPFNQVEGWNPIGDVSVPFSGHYNGDGKQISNLLVNTINLDAGLFGKADNAVLERIVLTAVNIHKTGVEQNSTGGLVGNCSSCEIRECSVEGCVQGYSFVGGLIGFCSGTSVSDSYSTAAVSAWSYVGGLAGRIAAGTSITRCYSIGMVASTYNDSHGGLIGSSSNSIVFWSYWNLDTSFQSNSAGGLGRTTAEMTFPYADNTYQGWDFNYVWQPDSLEQNNGYPYLRFLYKVAQPEIFHSPVEIGSPVLVTITCATPSAELRYTLDNSVPSPESALYLEPFWVECDADSAVTIKVIAYLDGLIPSQLVCITIFWGTPTTVQDQIDYPNLSCSSYPNPFRISTTISFYLPKKSRTNLSVYNAKGQCVRRWEIMGKAGSNQMIWDGTSDNGSRQAAGIYILKCHTESAIITRKLLLH